MTDGPRYPRNSKKYRSAGRCSATRHFFWRCPVFGRCTPSYQAPRSTAASRNQAPATSASRSDTSRRCTNLSTASAGPLCAPGLPRRTICPLSAMRQFLMKSRSRPRGESMDPSNPESMDYQDFVEQQNMRPRRGIKDAGYAGENARRRRESTGEIIRQVRHGES